jgi:hypothetical protein
MMMVVIVMIDESTVVVKSQSSDEAVVLFVCGFRFSIDSLLLSGVFSKTLRIYRLERSVVI